jgi:hypothetical protein
MTANLRTGNSRAKTKSFSKLCREDDDGKLLTIPISISTTTAVSGRSRFCTAQFSQYAIQGCSSGSKSWHCCHCSVRLVELKLPQLTPRAQLRTLMASTLTFSPSNVVLQSLASLMSQHTPPCARLRIVSSPFATSRKSPRR